MCVFNQFELTIEIWWISFNFPFFVYAATLHILAPETSPEQGDFFLLRGISRHMNQDVGNYFHLQTFSESGLDYQQVHQNDQQHMSEGRHLHEMQQGCVEMHKKLLRSHFDSWCLNVWIEIWNRVTISTESVELWCCSIGTCKYMMHTSTYRNSWKCKHHRCD